MKSYEAINAEITENREKIEALTAEIIELDRIEERREAAKAGQHEVVKALREESKRNADAIAANCEEIETLKIINCILRENRKFSLASEAMPVIISAFSKYAGKPYGEKTREKIRGEIRAAGYSVYISNDRMELCISKLDETGHTYGGHEIEINSSYTDRFITDENRVNLEAIAAAKIRFKYTENQRQTALEIREKYAEVKKALEDAAKVVSEYDAMIFDGMKRADAPRAPYSII